MSTKKFTTSDEKTRQRMIPKAFVYRSSARCTPGGSHLRAKRLKYSPAYASGSNAMYATRKTFSDVGSHAISPPGAVEDGSQAKAASTARAPTLPGWK